MLYCQGSPILFDAIGNGNIISFKDCSLFVYRNATDFSVLTLYPATLLSSFTLKFSGGIFRVFYIRSYLQTEIILFLPFQLGCVLFLFLA